MMDNCVFIKGLCNNYQEGGGGAKNESHKEKYYTIPPPPPLNKGKLALTPLQISQKLWYPHHHHLQI